MDRWRGGWRGGWREGGMDSWIDGGCTMYMYMIICISNRSVGVLIYIPQYIIYRGVEIVSQLPDILTPLLSCSPHTLYTVQF